MHALPPASYRTGPDPQVERRRRRGADAGRRRWRFERMLDGVDRAGAVELARFALADDRLLDADHMLLWILAVDVLLRGGRRPAATCGGDARSHARARGQPVRDARGEPLAGLRAVAAAAGSTTRCSRWATPRSRCRMWGSVRRSATRSPPRSPPASSSTAATSTRPTGRSGDARTLPRIGEGARQLRHGHRPAAARPGPARGGAGRAATPTSVTSRSPTPPGHPGGDPAARALAALGRHDEALRAGRRAGRAAAPVGRAVRAGRRRCSWPASSAAPTGSRCCGRRSTRSRRPGRRWTWPGPGSRWAGVPRSIGRGGAAVAGRGRRRARLRRRGRCSMQAVAALADRGEQRRNLGRRGSGIAVTGRERRVLDLTAAGLDVHQVAQRLFLTPGTVHEVLAARTAKARGPAMTRSSDLKCGAGTLDRHPKVGTAERAPSVDVDRRAGIAGPPARRPAPAVRRRGVPARRPAVRRRPPTLEPASRRPPGRGRLPGVPRRGRRTGARRPRPPACGSPRRAPATGAPPLSGQLGRRRAAAHVGDDRAADRRGAAGPPGSAPGCCGVT